MKEQFKSLIKALPPIKGLVAERDALIKANGFAPPGHFYSPVVSLPEVTADQERVFGAVPREPLGIEMHEARQLELLAIFEKLYPTIPFPKTKTDGYRYFYENSAYSYSDAIFLHCMIRHLAPKRLIEIGSGYSSCATLDTNERFFANAIATTFIEPYPQLLQSLITEDDRGRVEIVPKRVQDVELSLFDRLQSNDILFIDSTHVSKTGSDVNFLFFDVLPRLASGVHIHIHDVFYPFEYPKDWVLGGRSWNEIYLLRAFLQFNNRYEVLFMNTFLEDFHKDRFRANMPLCLANTGGSIWLRRV